MIYCKSNKYIIMEKNENFFEKQSASSYVKAKIVSSYFPQYCRILSKFPQKQFRYIDLFAGPGLYGDGHESTPLMIAKECYEDENLRKRVWMLFNDKKYKGVLEENFMERYPKGTFGKEPFFADRTIGECDTVERYLQKNTMVNGKNSSPALLFFDPFGYKGIKTQVLADFLKNWGNEIFLFLNTKRINPAIDNALFLRYIKDMFPLSYAEVKLGKGKQEYVITRLAYIVDMLGREFNLLLNKSVYYTAFQFQEEDINTTSHFILHLTKNAKGYELVKTIYNDFANVGTTFDGFHTYTFDPKLLNKHDMELFDYSSDNIQSLADRLLGVYKGKVIDARTLFDKDQVNTKYCLSHYTEALRKLVEEGKIKSNFIDGKKHKVSVLIIKECMLEF